MAVVNLELFKKHVNADDFTEDDDLLQVYLDAAEAYVVAATNRTLDELTEMGGGTFPVQLSQAIMLLAADSYNNRENSQSMQFHEVPYGATAMIKQFRKLAD